MATRELAPGVLQIPMDPIQGTNAYLLGDVLVDAGTRHDAKRILKALAGRPVTAHALTHAHGDHQGSSHEVATALRLPFLVPAGETEAAETGELAPLMPATRRAAFVTWAFTGPGHAVERELSEGEELGGFTVIALPGHSPGHVGYWRESDRVLIAGDAFRNISYATGRPRAAVPPAFFTFNSTQARRSVERIQELRPRVLAMGHGRPIVGELAVDAAVAVALAR